MKIAYTMAPGRGDTDLLLYALAQTLAGQGHRTCGVVQINTDRPDEGPCDMDVQVLPDGAILRISQTLGRESIGCRLDPNALETAVGLVEVSSAQGVDCLIINKFGKHEGEGRGFRAAIAEALSQDIPVIVGLNTLNQPAFMEFCGDLAVELPPEKVALTDWICTQILNARQAA